jgi:hypothetical protein
MMCHFGDQPPGMVIAAFGDGTFPDADRRGIFAGHQSEKSHEFAGVLEAANVADLTQQNYGGQ